MKRSKLIVAVSIALCLMVCAFVAKSNVASAETEDYNPYTSLTTAPTNALTTTLRNTEKIRMIYLIYIITLIIGLTINYIKE